MSGLEKVLEKRFNRGFSRRYVAKLADKVARRALVNANRMRIEEGLEAWASIETAAPSVGAKRDVSSELLARPTCALPIPTKTPGCNGIMPPGSRALAGDGWHWTRFTRNERDWFLYLTYSAGQRPGTVVRRFAEAYVNGALVPFIPELGEPKNQRRLIHPADRALHSFVLEAELSKRAYERARADG